jgi:hypothetical protein
MMQGTGDRQCIHCQGHATSCDYLWMVLVVDCWTWWKQNSEAKRVIGCGESSSQAQARLGAVFSMGRAPSLNKASCTVDHQR